MPRDEPVRRRLPPRSLRGRLVLGATAIALVVASLAGVAGTLWVRAAETQSLTSALQTRLQLAEEDVRPDGTLPSEPRGPKSDLVQVLGPGGGVLAASSALSGLRPLADERVVRASPDGVRGTVSLQSPDVDLATLAVPWTVTRGGAPLPTVLLVAVDTEGFSTARDDLSLLLLAGLVIGVVTLALLVHWVSGRALRDVTALARQAETTPATELRHGLPVPPSDAELGALVSAFNRMLLRLHVAHTHELAFAAEAGHRLRTPLATLRAEAELALDEAGPAEQAQALRRVVEDADELAAVVDGLLASTRALVDGTRPLEVVLARAAAQWHRQASTSGVGLVVSAPSGQQGWTCPGLREVVDPLVDNAIRHCTPGGRVLVQVALDVSGPRPSATVVVSNDGADVPVELSGSLFEPWVTGGGPARVGGLGLWTSKRTAEDQGGEVELLERRDGRTRFRVRLPVVALEARTDRPDG